MGIYDREYYRDKTRGSGWLSGEAPACKLLIAINVVAFIAQKVSHSSVDELFRANSDLIFHHFQVWRLLTGTFLHADPWHILFNMLFLWMVGREMESFYGTRDFTVLYIASAIVSTLCWAVADTFDPTTGMIGASGAVMSVVVLYTLYYPRREILFMFIIPVQMWVLLVVYLGSDLIQFLNPNPNPFNGYQTAYAAHLGGAVFGYLFKVGDLRLSRLETMFRRTPRLRIVPAEPRESSPTSRPSMGPSWSPGTAASTRPAPTAVVPEELFDEKLDEILVKIAREGRGSLSEDENRVLEEASRRARNRRSERI